VDLIIIGTLVKGGIYALLAVGFSLIFGVARLINLAHTGFYMLAAYGVWYFCTQLGLGIAESIIISVVAVTLLGTLSYRFIIDRIREHHAAVLLITLGLAMVFEQLMYMFFTGDYQTIPDYVSGYVEILGVRVTNQYVLLLSIVAVMIIVVMLFLTKTKLGTAIRATANDAEVASLMGISVPRTLMVTMGIATFLGAVAGVIGGAGKHQGEHHRGFHHRIRRDINHRYASCGWLPEDDVCSAGYGHSVNSETGRAIRHNSRGGEIVKWSGVCSRISDLVCYRSRGGL